jgi:RecA/RadA recombinase
MGFVTGLERLLSESKETCLSTGSPELDRLLGGITRDRFYYFYGDPELLGDLFRHLLVNALKSTSRNSEPRAVYILCGNYRVEKTLIETEPLTRLLVASGMAPESSLSRIHVLTASSADQQSLLAEELERLLEREPEFNLVLVRGIYKLQKDDARVR